MYAVWHNDSSYSDILYDYTPFAHEKKPAGEILRPVRRDSSAEWCKWCNCCSSVSAQTCALRKKSARKRVFIRLVGVPIRWYHV